MARARKTVLRSKCGRSNCGRTTFMDDETQSFGYGKLHWSGLWEHGCEICAKLWALEHPGAKVMHISTAIGGQREPISVEVFVDLKDGGGFRARGWYGNDGNNDDRTVDDLCGLIRKCNVKGWEILLKYKEK